MTEFWNKFFYSKMQDSEFALFRFFAYLFSIFSWMIINPVEISKNIFVDLFYEPRLLYGLAEIRGSIETLQVSSALFGLFLFFSAIGFLNRFSRVSALIFGYYLYGLKYNYSSITYSDSCAMLAILILALAPLGYSLSVDRYLQRKYKKEKTYPQEVEVWSIRLCQLSLVFIIFSSALLKLRINGYEWLTENLVGKSLQASTIYFLPYEYKISEIMKAGSNYVRDFLIGNFMVGSLLTKLSLFHELTFPMVFFKKTRNVILILTLIFLFVIRLLMGHTFVFSLAPLFLAWVDWKKIKKLVFENKGESNL